VLGRGEVGEAVGNNEPQLPVGTERPLPGKLLGPPEATLGIVEAVRVETILVGLVDGEELGVLGGHAAGFARRAKPIGPDIEPLELGDESAEQIDEPARARDRAEMPEPPRGELFADQGTEELPFHDRAERTHGVGCEVEQLIGKLGKRDHARCETRPKATAEQRQADLSGRPPVRRQPEGGTGFLVCEGRPVALEQAGGLARARGAGQGNCSLRADRQTIPTLGVS